MPSHHDWGIDDEPDPVDHFVDIRGPQECPHPCPECPDRRHHWITVCFPGCLEPGDDGYEEASRHPAVLEGHGETGWLECRHCGAWHPITDEMRDDPDFDFP